MFSMKSTWLKKSFMEDLVSDFDDLGNMPTVGLSVGEVWEKLLHQTPSKCRYFTNKWDFGSNKYTELWRLQVHGALIRKKHLLTGWLVRKQVHASNH